MSIATEAYAKQQDAEDPLRAFQKLFIIPTKRDLSRKTLASTAVKQDDADERSVYLCGNSLGLQPTYTRKYFEQYLDTWAAKGVYGHFTKIEDSNLAPWLDVDDSVQGDMAEIVGAQRQEVAVMQTLTTNLHLMMASFYKPSKERFKIILEGKAFPSDHYAVESQLRHHDIDAANAMVLIEPPSKDSPILPTEHILSIIEEHASQTALLLLPGIQFYSGQLFDIANITKYAQERGILVGWDLAHAAGNVPLQLHDWNVDFAAWCTYKYLNCGPGSIGGCFIHERHGTVSQTPDDNGEPTFEYRPRLSGWWGSSKDSRFAMTNKFHPIVGAAGYQISNTSVADTTAVRASLDIFKQTSMGDLRRKSIKLTKYLQDLLDLLAKEQDGVYKGSFRIITPLEAEQRGAQLSVLLSPGLLDSVMVTLEKNGVHCNFPPGSGGSSVEAAEEWRKHHRRRRQEQQRLERDQMIFVLQVKYVYKQRLFHSSAVRLDNTGLLFHLLTASSPQIFTTISLTNLSGHVDLPSPLPSICSIPPTAGIHHLFLSSPDTPGSALTSSFFRLIPNRFILESILWASLRIRLRADNNRETRDIRLCHPRPVLANINGASRALTANPTCDRVFARSKQGYVTLGRTIHLPELMEDDIYAIFFVERHAGIPLAAMRQSMSHQMVDAEPTGPKGPACLRLRFRKEEMR
nr:kynureninase 1 [Quercus suber]